MIALGLLHSAPSHVARFDHLLAELAPGLAVRHLVRADLLDRAIHCGCVSDDVAVDLAASLQTLVDDGARVVLCTCSSLGPAAEQIGRAWDADILRLDRALAEAAVAAGPRLLLVCTVRSTLAPTKVLIEDVARLKGRAVVPQLLVDEPAWALFKAGDEAGYAAHIAAAIRAEAGPFDAVVLAQASMETVPALLTDLGVPVLASPRLGLQAALGRLNAS